MADIAQLERALINADRAGDSDAARVFAAEIRKLRSAPAPAGGDADYAAQAQSYIANSRAEQSAQAKSEGEKARQSLLMAAPNLAAGAVRGAGSIGSTLLAPIDMAKDAIAGKGLSLQSNRERRAGIDGGLRELGANPDSLMYKTGKLGGEIAGTAGAGGVLANGARFAGASPAFANALATGGMRAGTTSGAANMLTRIAGGAITGGATAGLVNPEDAVAGAAMGGALPPVVAGVGGAGRAIGRSFSIGDGNRALAQKAVNQYGIPLGVGDIAEGGTIKAVRSILNDAPFSGGVGAAQREGVQEGFNRAVGGTFGAPEKKLTADVVDAAKKRMGAEFDRIWNNNTMAYDGQLFNDIQALRKEAAKLPGDAAAHHGGGDAKRLAAWLDDIESKMVADQNGGMYLPGDVANRLQSKLRKEAASASGFLKEDITKLRKSLIGAFNRNVSPADAQALAQNMGQYKAFKTIEPLLNSAEAGVAGRMPGDVPAALLPQAVARQYSQAGNAPLGELSQIGSRFLVDRTAKTGGSMRAALQNTALGTALIGGGLSNPLLAAGAIPAAAGTNALLGSPALARFLLNGSPPNRLSMLLSSPETAQLAYRAAPVISAQ